MSEIVTATVVRQPCPNFIALKETQEQNWVGRAGDTADAAGKAYRSYFGEAPRLVIAIAPETPAPAVDDLALVEVMYHINNAEGRLCIGKSGLALESVRKAKAACLAALKENTHGAK